MFSNFTLALAEAAEGHEAAGVHWDAILVGGLVFAALMLAMLVTMSFSKAANRHPETPVRNDPHRLVHARPAKH